jgi:hypothetical protein
MSAFSIFPTYLYCAERISRLCLSADRVDDADEILASARLRLETLEQRAALGHQVVVAGLVKEVSDERKKKKKD